MDFEARPEVGNDETRWRRLQLREAVEGALWASDRELRDLDHVHAVLDANARHLIAEIAVDVFLGAPPVERSPVRRRTTVPEKWEPDAWWAHVAACEHCSVYYEPPDVKRAPVGETTPL